MTIRHTNYRREYPQASKNAFRKWFSFRRFWGGKLIHISVRRHTIVLDFRKDVWADVMRGSTD